MLELAASGATLTLVTGPDLAAFAGVGFWHARRATRSATRW